jgi:predicted patatin/cPLA2 family phospholipase
MYQWTTKASYYEFNVNSITLKKTFRYIGWSYATKKHWTELVRWVKSGNVVCINDKLYFNEKKLRYDLEDMPTFSNVRNKASLNHVPISHKEWIL